MNMEASYGHFDKHISDTNMDFKEEIHRKVQTIKLEDTAELNNRVSSKHSPILFYIIFAAIG